MSFNKYEKIGLGMMSLGLCMAIMGGLMWNSMEEMPALGWVVAFVSILLGVAGLTIAVFAGIRK
jgi:hypothetical protein